MSSPDVSGILENSKELDRLRKEQEEVLLEINKMHKKLQSTPEVVEKPGDISLARLKMLYIQAKELSESEVSISSQLLSQIDAIMPLGTQGQHRRRIEGSEQKKKRMRTDSDVPRLSPAMRSHLEGLANLKGEQVAARVSQDGAGKDEWFVVKVIHFDKETREFEVLDEEPGDDEEGTGQRKYKLPMSHIISFPKRNDLSSVPDFPPGKHVLAVYPETTALYKATVVQARKRKTDDYVLEFDDDEEDGSLPQRFVPFHRVVPLPEGYRICSFCIVHTIPAYDCRGIRTGTCKYLSSIYVRAVSTPNIIARSMITAADSKRVFKSYNSRKKLIRKFILGSIHIHQDYRGIRKASSYIRDFICEQFVELNSYVILALHTPNVIKVPRFRVFYFRNCHRQTANGTGIVNPERPCSSLIQSLQKRSLIKMKEKNAIA